MRRTYFRTRPLPVRHVTDVTSGEKAPLGRILRNLRLRMHRKYFRTGLRSRDWRDVRSWSTANDNLSSPFTTYTSGKKYKKIFFFPKFSFNTIPKRFHVFIQDRGWYIYKNTPIVSWKITKDNHLSTLTFIISRLPVKYFTCNSAKLTLDGYWFILRFFRILLV